MTPLDQSKPGGAIFPESFSEYAPHLLLVSASIADETVESLLDMGIRDKEELSYVEWYEKMMNDLSVENIGLHDLLSQYFNVLHVRYSVWVQLVGGWIFALRKEYARRGRFLPLLSRETTAIFNQRKGANFSTMLDALRTETHVSVGSWCTLLREIPVPNKKKDEILKVLCSIAVLLDLAVQNDLTPGTTPRSD